MSTRLAGLALPLLALAAPVLPGAEGWRAYREGRHAAAGAHASAWLAASVHAPRAERSSALDLAARLAREREDFDGALRLIEERLRVWRGARTPEGRGEWARAYVDRSGVHFRLSRFRAAGVDADSAAIVAGDRLAADPLLAAALKVARGNTLYHLGAVAEATREHEEALAIRRRRLPPGDADLAQSLVNVATMRWRAGDYDAAIALDDEAIAALAGVGEGRHPMIGEARSRRAYAERDRGDLVAARADWERAIAELSAAHGGDHTSVGRARAALSDLLGTLGDEAAALAMAERTLASARRRLPETHRDVGRARIAVGEARLAIGDLGAARAALEAGLRAIEAAGGRDNPDLDQALAARADLALAERDTVGARAWFARRLGINARALGEAHPRVGRTLLALGELALARGDLAGARDTLQRAAAVLAALGDGDPVWAQARAALARIELAAGDAGAARTHALAAEAAGRAHFRLNAEGLTGAEALRYARLRPRGLDLAVTAALAAPADADAARACWDALVRSRALVLDELALRRRIAAGGDSTVRAAARELQRASARLAHVVARAAGGDSLAAWRAARDAAFARREHAERGLAALSAPLRAALAARQVALAQVEAALPPGTGLVAYVRLAGESGAARYVAFVRGPDGAARMLALGDAPELEPVFERWRAQLASPPDSTRLAAALAACTREGDAVRRVVWDPVARYVGSARDVWVVRDGALLTLPLAALPAADGRPLVLAGPALRFVDAERDLVPVREVAPGRGLLAIGAPAAGCDTCAIPGPCGGLGPALRPLPGAADELRDVVARWRAADAGAELLAGADATVAALADRAGGHLALHVATHGWAREAPCDDGDVPGRRGVGRLVSRPQARLAAGAEARSPLLASGLAFSPSVPGQADGVVTAEELAALDLAGVELVVLSACETGLGEVRSGEGVLGLQRAMRIAGARQLVVSLWSVDDRSTREWMARFHAAWLTRREATDAVREACRAWLARPPHAAARHPFHWAAFTATGR